ncbi:discoidin domain-containing protein [Bariatricus sp. SGI.154]|uniref:galactose-binding domain-containing protein n=1 Tax=Bariatricus sp. SGI.154 TaxID=3420549 RepID=UPI003D05C4A6
MKIPFNTNGHADPPIFYLADPEGQIICPLNAIHPESLTLTMNLNDTAQLTFTYDNTVNLYGVLVPSNGYELLDEFMRIYVEHIGWFIMSAPQISNDGKSETKQVSAQSVDIELTNQDLVGFKVNCGTTDSIEMLSPDNVDYIDGVPFAKEQVTFCNKENPELSLLHMLLSYAGVEGWSIGYIDEIPKVYRSYVDGELTESVVQLKDEIGTFDIDSQSVYSFLTQDIEQFFECIIRFDINTMTINAYRPEHIGKDTNVTIGFRNLQNSNDISVDKNSIYTRYRVSGDDNLGIGYVNFGSDMIENLSYFLNTRYMSESLIAKYQAWQSDMESKRYEYISYVRQYNQQLAILSELMDRVPLDDCSAEWNKFSTENLTQAKEKYLAQKEGYEAFYVDENGNFDEAKLIASPDANDYYQIRDVILPSIEIEFSNRELSASEGKRPYIDTYKTNWQLYGIDELLVNLDFYKSQKDALEQAHYDLTYADYSAHTDESPAAYPAHTRDMHEEMHAQYLDTIMQLDATIAGTCACTYEERTQEYESQETLAEEALSHMNALAAQMDKNNWSMEGVDGFTAKELRTLSRLYRDTDYTNPHMFLTDSDDPVSAIDEQLKLLDAAIKDLEATSQPQYIYRTDLDNFLTLYDYRDYTNNLELGDFLYLGTQDDSLVRLRLISYSYHPLSPTGNLQIEFSNMIRTGSKRYDTTYLLGLAGNTSKNSITGSSNNSSRNEGTSLTAGLIRKILASSIFQGKLSDTINRHFGSIIGQLVVSKNLESEMIRTIDIDAENGFFQYLQAQLIATNKIITDSAIINQLSTLTANIQKALIGTSHTETGIVMKLTADNAVIDEAFIKNVISQYISVNELKAGNLDTNQIHILSEDGTLSIVGNTQQFKDKDGHVRIQIGEDDIGNFTFIVYDRNGQGVLIDQDGIHASAIADGLIRNQMLADKTIESQKIDWTSCGAATDTAGNPIWNSAQITLNGQGLDIQFASITDQINAFETSIDTMQTRIEGVQSMVNAVNKSITDKVWRTDLVEVTDEKGNTISQSIVDLLVEHNISLSGLTSTVRKVEDTAGTLATQVSTLEQDAGAFRQTVSTIYATKDEVEVSTSLLIQKDTEISGKVTDLQGNLSTLSTSLNDITARVESAEGNITSLNVTTEGLQTNVSDTQGNISTLQQTAESLESTLARKQDAMLSSVRFIRDWLNGSTADTDNRWVECQVMSDNNNIAASIIPELYDQSHNPVETSQDLALYTDGTLLLSPEEAGESSDTSETYIHTEAGGNQYLLLDLGTPYSIDSITIWHYYSDRRTYNHRLEISNDGINWQCLYNSQHSGGYTESESGRTYYLSDSAATAQYSRIRQDLGTLDIALYNVENAFGDFQDTINGQYSELQASFNTLTSKITDLENGVDTNSSTITQTSDKWEALFQTLGMIEGGQTNISLSAKGMEVLNPLTGVKTLITIDEFAGYYNDEKIFSLNEDLTQTKRILVENGLDTCAIKLIPSTYTLSDGTTYRALVHVRSGGTS